MRKKGILEALVRALLSLYKNARTKGKAGTHLSKEFKVNVEVHQKSLLLLLMFAIMIYVATNEKKEGMLLKIIFANDLAIYP